MFTEALYVCNMIMDGQAGLWRRFVEHCIVFEERVKLVVSLRHCLVSDFWVGTVQKYD